MTFQIPADSAAEIEPNIRRHIDMLAAVIGERNAHTCFGALEATARYIEDEFRAMGYATTPQEFSVDLDDLFNHRD